MLENSNYHYKSDEQRKLMFLSEASTIFVNMKNIRMKVEKKLLTLIIRTDIHRTVPVEVRKKIIIRKKKIIHNCHGISHYLHIIPSKIRAS